VTGYVTLTSASPWTEKDTGIGVCVCLCVWKFHVLGASKSTEFMLCNKACFSRICACNKSTWNCSERKGGTFVLCSLKWCLQIDDGFCLCPSTSSFVEVASSVTNRSCIARAKAMLHEAIFLATWWTQGWRIKKLSSCSGGVTRLQLFSQLATRTKIAEISREQKMSSDWPILTKLRCKLLRGCYTHATCLATLRKVESRSTFLATRNPTIAVAKWGVTRGWSFACNLQRNVCCVASCKENCFV